MDSKIDVIEDYWSRRAEGFSTDVNRSIRNNRTDLKYAEILGRHLPKISNPNCLDLGCGPGLFSMLLGCMGYRVTAMDISLDMLRKAKQNCEFNGIYDNVYIKGNIEELPFEDETFDYIVSKSVVWNLEDPERAYSEWVRVLKPAGKLMICDGNYYLKFHDDKYKKYREANPHEQDYYGVDASVIDDIARDLPLSKVLRPGWDVNTLLTLGIENVVIEAQNDYFTDEVTGEEECVITSFVIAAEK